LAGRPAVLLCQVPAAALLADADNDVDAVVPHIQRLAAALHAVAQHRHGFLPQDRPKSFRWVIGALDDGFDIVPDLNLTHGLSLDINPWSLVKIAIQSVAKPAITVHPR